MGAVKNALTREGYDPSIMDLDPAKSVEYQQAVEGMSKGTDLDPEKSIPINKEELDDKGPPLNEDPKYMKFFTMLNMVRGYHMCTSCSYVSNQSYICHSS